ncbi:MAG TPA: LysE family translocator [Gaiellaceae bacterium]|nr:LysE family translocator [Gaiellaceae bacterium]
MPPPSTLAVFAAAALALAVVPGPAVAYVVARSVEHGRRAGLLSVLGVSTGGLVHVAAATAGLSALLASSASAFTVVKLAGAAYLITIGLLRLLGRGEDAAADVAPVRCGRVYVQGVIVNVLNPKTALFFLAFLPQFVSPHRWPVAAQVSLLGCLFVLIAAASDSVYALTAAALAGRMRAGSRVARLKRFLTGGIFVALGATAAAAKRAT